MTSCPKARRLHVSLSAALVLAATLAALGGSAPAAAVPGNTVRISGASRYDTAAKVALRQFSAGAQTAVVTSGEQFPDALVAGPLAASEGGRPLLLTRKDDVPAETRNALSTLSPREIVVVGGESAVSAAAFAQLEQLAESVTRIRGGDRFSTAVAVSRAVAPAQASAVYLAFGRDFPDAVVAGALGARAQEPVLLVERDSVPQPVATRLEELSPQEVFIVGGAGVISEAVAARVRELTGVTPERVRGGDRFATSVAGADHAYPNGAATVYIATGRNFPDALSAGPAAAAEDAPVLLVEQACMPEAVRLAVEALGADNLIVIGGSGVVSERTAQMQSCDPAPRGTITANVRFSGSGVGYAAYLNIHDLEGNAVAMGMQSDVNDSPTEGRPWVHTNVFRDPDHVPAGSPAGFDHKYGTLQLQNNVTYKFQLDYLRERELARLKIDDVIVLEVPVRLVGRLFFQTEVNVARNGDSVDATFTDVRIGGFVAEGNGRGTAVEPNGTWNTSSFDFYDLDMQQLDSEVQGADMRGSGTASGVPDGKDWHTVETVRPGEPLAAIGMIAEYWFGQ